MADLFRRVRGPLLGERYVRDVDVAPEALVSRLRGAINNRPKRALGVLKVSAEWIGVVRDNEFRVWERQGHATRATGRITARRGGAHIEADIGITRRTRAMTIVFFALFAVGALGVLAREGGLGIGPPGLAVAALGAMVTLTLFWSASLRQRAALRAFLDAVFSEPGSA